MLHRAASYCALLVALLSASSVPAQSLEDLLKGSDGLLAPTTAPEEDPEVSVTLHPITGQPQLLLLAVRVELPDGAYTYSQDPAFLGHSAIEVARINGAKPIDDRFLPDHAPKRAYDEIFEQDIEKFTNEVTWYRRFQMTDGVAPGDVEIVGELRYQVCKNTCRQFKHPFTAKVSGESVALPAAFAAAAPADPATGGGEFEFAYRIVPTRKVGGEPKADPLSVQFELFPRDAKAGEIVTFAVTMDIDKGWNTYALQPTDDQFQNPTEIDVLELANLEPAGELTESPAPELEESELGTANIHRGRVTWSRRYTVKDDAPYGLSALMIYQVCDESSRCLPPKDIEFALGSLQTTPPDSAEPVATPVLASTSTPAPPQAPTAATGDAPAATGERQFQFDEGDRPAGLGWNLVLAFLGGLILNIMPCVLPVLAIKVLSFVQQAGESRGRILLLNGTYSLGVLAVFLTLASLAVFLGYGWGQLFQYDGFNLVMACVVFAMGLSLLGVFEIPIPGMIGAAAGGEHREGLTGAFMTGIFATLLATPCSGPFMGTTLAWSVRQPAVVVYLVWGMMGIGMASPYLLIGLFPQLVKWLPRPGMWMVRFKEFAGFVLMGTVIFLVNAIDEALIIPALIMMLGIALGLWMVGSLYNQTTPEPKKWAIRIAAVALAAPILWYGWGQYDRALADKELRAASDDKQLVVHEDELPWQPFSTERLEELLAAGTPTLVDFTADWCLICKQNEKFALNTEKTIQFVKEHGVVTLYADYTDESPEIKKWLDIFQQNGVPLTVVFPADNPEEPKVLRGPYSQGHLLSILKDSVKQPARTAMAPENTSER
ncbi:protein-disulfide reductase DsbD domain-containing protein [Maioricimonas sp. JC845]|uniref:protein-disulfide reductase DsbD family protein n=1 Tax=Maioricimonas sp. JC845 TaxID=3232138 RepID=UPI0034580672